MKKISIIIIEALIPLSFIAIVLLFSSCKNAHSNEDTKIIAEDYNAAKFNNYEMENDAQFLVNASEISLEEILLGKLAQQRGRSEHVKEFAKMMEDAHTKSQVKLAALAESKDITIPTSPTDNARKAYKTLNDKSGSDFDKSYSDLMVSRHKDAISTFESASSDLYDAEIKSYASASIHDLRKHLDYSIDCQKKCEKLSNQVK